MTIPTYLASMVRRAPPKNTPVIPLSTPVVAFGDPTSSNVATLGIKPSDREFREDGLLLRGVARRLATLESLGARSLDELTDDQVESVFTDCATYFQRRPYRRWFDPLDEVLTSGLGASYYDGSACHLDIVQWATDPKWGDIRDAEVRRALLDDGVPHLRAQLETEKIRLVLLNGLQVVEQVAAVGLTKIWELGKIPFRESGCRLFAGDGGGVLWLGWSTNLQSSPGVSREFRGSAGGLAPSCPK